MHTFTIEANNFGSNCKTRKTDNYYRMADDFVPNILIWKPRIQHNSKSAKKYIQSGILPKIQAGEGKDKYLTYRKKPTLICRQQAFATVLIYSTQHISRPHTEQDKNISDCSWQTELVKKERLLTGRPSERLKPGSNRTSSLTDLK